MPASLFQITVIIIISLDIDKSDGLEYTVFTVSINQVLPR